MFDLVANWQFRSRMKVHFNSPQVQRSHIMWGWPLKTGFQKIPKNKNSETVAMTSFFFPFYGSPRFLENVRKRTRLWKSALCDANSSSWGLVPPSEAGRLFFLSHAKHVEGSKISIGSNRKLKRGILVGGSREPLCGHLESFYGINNMKYLNFRPSLSKTICCNLQ